MKTLMIACGNPMRRDDGVAHVAITLAANKFDAVVHHVHQLTPELAAQLADFDRVVFVDADVSAGGVAIEPVRPEGAGAISHASSPAEIVQLARQLFKFSGEAWVCSIPAQDFSAGEGLTGEGLLRAERAAWELERFIGDAGTAA